jgi:serine/threonine protein kinase
MGKSNTESGQDPLIGRTFGSYEILSEVASGGMGTVYRAQHIKLAKVVAVKVLSANMQAVEEYVMRFEREAQLAARLEHPNIVRIYDYGNEDDVIYLVMQFVEGESLAERMKREQRLPLLESMHITREIAKGLDIAHENNLVHRDIKPDNILISKRGEIMITDFGLVKMESEQDGPRSVPIDVVDNSISAELTVAGSFMGTPYYMSPEQCQGLPDIDGRADLYSLGLILYALVTGRAPAEGSNALMIMQNRILNKPIPAIEHNPKIGRPLNDLIMHLLEREPDQRLPTARVLVQRLNGLFPVYAPKKKYNRPRRAPTSPENARPVTGPTGSQGIAAPVTAMQATPKAPRPPIPILGRQPTPPRPPASRPPAAPALAPVSFDGRVINPIKNVDSVELNFSDYADQQGLALDNKPQSPQPVFIQGKVTRQAAPSDPELGSLQPLPANVSMAPTPMTPDYSSMAPAPSLPDPIHSSPAPAELTSLAAPFPEAKEKVKAPVFLIILLMLTVIGGAAVVLYENSKSSELSFIELTKLPEWTNKRELKITGLVSRGAINILVGTKESKTDQSGRFQQTIQLRSGLNEIVVEAYDKIGSSVKKTLSTKFDDLPPKFIIENDYKGRVTLDEERLLIGSIKDKNPAELIIDGKTIAFDKNGRFQFQLDKESDYWELRIILTDKAGNKSERSFRVISRAKIEFKKLTKLPRWTKTKTWRISGQSSRKAKSLELNEKLMAIDDKGRFQFDLTLSDGPNNYLLVLNAEDGGRKVHKIVIGYDNQKPSLKVDNERLPGKIFLPEDNSLRGRVKDLSLDQIKINGQSVSFKKSGEFAHAVAFEKSKRKSVTVSMKDLVGNEKQQTFQVFSGKHLVWIKKPVIPTTTKQKTLLIEGTLNLKPYIVTIGSKSARSDPLGNFKLEVELPDKSNQLKLKVKAKNGASLEETYSVQCEAKK